MSSGEDVKHMKRIILASSSPRRKDLLIQIGLRFDVEPSNCPEGHSHSDEPHEITRSLSLQKARQVARKHKDALVIGADTVVEVHGRILGKPAAEDEAIQMLKKLSGRAHRVITGFTVLDTESARAVTDSVETKVYMKHLDEDEIAAYVRSGEPLGKAGGYAIQGLGSIIIERIEGDYHNVVGLPVGALAKTLEGFGIRVL